jgi:hypothetical protein
MTFSQMGEGFAVLLKAYMDRGAKPQAQGIMCVATVIFAPPAYKKFCREWRKFLRSWGVDAFHATDFYPGGGDFWRKLRDGTMHPERMARFQADSRRIPGLIGDAIRQCFVTSFRQREFESVAPPGWRDHFGSINGVAAQVTAAAIGHWSNRVRFGGKVAYIIEDGDDGIEMETSLRRLYDHPARRDHSRMAAPPVRVPKGNAKGLEASDFLAWHWNKFYVDSVAAMNPRKVRNDFAAFVKFRPERVQINFFTGEHLERFLAENGCVRTPRQSLRLGLVAFSRG